MKVMVGDPAGFVESDSFRFKQSSFHLRTTSKTAKSAVGTYHPMTGYQYREWVGRQSGADGTGGFGFAEMCGQKAIRSDTPARDCICRQ